jgi:ornithine--oxo-acid transaminase
VSFDLAELIKHRGMEKFDLYSKYINPWAVATARKFGLDKHFVGAEGIYVYDHEGNRYLDMDGGLGVFCLGRNHPQIADAIYKLMALKTASLVNRDVHMLAGFLAEALAKRSPGDLNKVIFTNAGSETTEASLKFARKVTGRKRLLFLAGDFHGTTFGALSVTGTSDMRAMAAEFGPSLPDCVSIPHNDLPSLTKEIEKGDVAGFIVEPISGATVEALSREFMQTAQALCRKHGTMFIVDEILVGFGRTGRLFACEHYDIEPDMLLVSKALSGGIIPVGALIVRDEIHAKAYDRQGVFVHRSTYMENDFAMAAGLASIHIIENERLIENAATSGERLIDGLRQLQNKYSMIKDVRGLGLLIGIELRSPEGLTQRLSGSLLQKRGLLGHLVAIQLMEKRRVLAAPTRERNMLRIHPPYIISSEDVEYFLDSMDAVMKDLHRFPDGIAQYLVSKLLKG